MTISRWQVVIAIVLIGAWIILANVEAHRTDQAEALATSAQTKWEACMEERESLRLELWWSKAHVIELQRALGEEQQLLVNCLEALP